MRSACGTASSLFAAWRQVRATTPFSPCAARHGAVRRIGPRRALGGRSGDGGVGGGRSRPPPPGKKSGDAGGTGGGEIVSRESGARPAVGAAESSRSVMPPLPDEANMQVVLHTDPSVPIFTVGEFVGETFRWFISLVMLGFTVSMWYYVLSGERERNMLRRRREEMLNSSVLQNWWGTVARVVPTREVYVPDDEEDVLDLFRWCAERKHRYARAVGGGLSPNFVFDPPSGMIRLDNLRGVLSVDESAMEVTVGGGTSVGDVLDALHARGLTLRSQAAPREATLAGAVQCGCHGGRIHEPPIDADVVAMRLATPALGVLQLGASAAGRPAPSAAAQNLSPMLFRLARVSAGTLGVITQLTLRCERRVAVEHSVHVVSLRQLRNGLHTLLLQESEALHYLWYPASAATSAVRGSEAEAQSAAEVPPLGDDDVKRVVVSLCRRSAAPESSRRRRAQATMHTTAESVEQDEAAALGPLRALYEEQRQFARVTAAEDGARGEDAVEGDGNAVDDPPRTYEELRLALHQGAPGDDAFSASIARAELEYWRRRERQGVRRGWADDLLAPRDLGPHMLSEMCVPAGAMDEPSGADLAFASMMCDAGGSPRSPLQFPLWQTWSAGSSSLLSPAACPTEKEAESSLFSWVTIGFSAPLDEERAKRKSMALERFLYETTPLRRRFHAVESLWTANTSQPTRLPVKQMHYNTRNSVDPERILRSDRADEVLRWHPADERDTH